MKKRPSNSSGSTVKRAKHVKSGSGNNSSAVRSANHRVAVASPSRGKGKFSALEVITIVPGGSEEEPLSTEPENVQPVRFGYFRPEAKEIFVAGSFNDWRPRATPMKRDSLGDWSVELKLPPGEHRYRFLVDGEWHDVPSAELTAMNSYGGFDAVVVV